MPQVHPDPAATLAMIVGAQSKQIEALEKQVQELRAETRETNARLDKAKRWLSEYVRPRLLKNPRSAPRTPPANRVSKEDADLAYQIIREHTGKNYQVDSVYGDRCRALIAKHGLQTVTKVVAHACVQNAQKGSDQWSQPSTLFRPANFARWLDDWSAQNG